MTADDYGEQLTPAERRLEEHLQLLRSQAPPAPTDLARRVVHTARWQRSIRHPLLTVANLAATVADGVRLLFAPRHNRL